MQASDRLAVLITLCLGASLGAGTPLWGQADDDLVVGPPTGPWRRLFLDDAHIVAQQGLRRVFHPAQKHPNNPVIRPTEPWEGGRPYVHGTVLCDQGRLRMWYLMNADCPRCRYRNGYAESTDGLVWEKPKLGLCDYQGSKENNLVLTDKEVVALALNLNVIKRPWIGDPGGRYIAFFNSLATKPLTPRFALSEDGIHWTVSPAVVNGLRSGDELRVCYDPYRWRYVATCKCVKERRGRAVSLATSLDGVQWQGIEAGQPLVYSLETGNQANQIYEMPLFAYQGLYLGLPDIYHAAWPDHDRVSDEEMVAAEEGSPTTSEVEIAWSRDLAHWLRPPGAGTCPFIPLGPQGAFDCGLVMGAANTPVVMGDELWFYYGGWDGPHRILTQRAAIGLATLRLDGFASMQADAQEGWLVTPVETFSEPRVTINAQVAPGGQIVAELLDQNGQPVAGFDRQNCEPFQGDSVRQVLKWKEAGKGHLPPGGRMRIRFLLRNAELYSYLPG